MVDAKTGRIVHKNSLLFCADGWADTRYSGRKKISTEYHNGQYRLRDNSRSYGIETYNARNQNAWSWQFSSFFFDNDNSWNSWEYNNAYKDNAALDAHWGAMVTYDYYKQIHNRNSYDNRGHEVRVYVHADLGSSIFRT